MIKSFKDEIAEDVFSGEAVPVLSGDAFALVRRRLFAIDAATCVEDLRIPGSQLDALRSSCNEYALTVAGQWRIYFEFRKGNAYDVEICEQR